MNVEYVRLSHLKRFTVALLFSGSLNIALITFIGFHSFSDPLPLLDSYRTKVAALVDERSGGEVFSLFKNSTFEQLAAKLYNTQLVEDGYAQRDFALGCLVAFHHLDFHRALKGKLSSVEKREVNFLEKQSKKLEKMILFPGLSDICFKEIIEFVEKESYPLTSEGLYHLVKNEKSEAKGPLLKAFFLTEEVRSLETLFRESSIDENELSQLILECGWDHIKKFSEEFQKNRDLSPQTRQKFLLEAIALGSRQAAYLLLKTDGLFSAKKLDDHSIMVILELLNHPTKEAEFFLSELLSSARGERVLGIAGAKWQEFGREMMPPCPIEELVMKEESAFSLPSASSKEIVKEKMELPSLPIDTKEKATLTATPVALKEKTALKPTPIVRKIEDLRYTIQKGDCLWTIAKRHNVGLNTLREYNQLESDCIKPGKILLIPKNS